MILLSHPLSQYLSHEAEIDSALRNVLHSGWYILGKEVESFEREFAAFLGAKHAVGVANGTEALQLALMACGISEGDEVITVSHTAVATVAAIQLAGATPVLVDIDNHFTLDPQNLEKALTSKTKAVVPVHLYGQAAEMESIQAFCAKHGLLLIEDCAQAHGARYQGKRLGSFGKASAFSFYPTKNLGALGDGGAVVTSDPEVFQKLKLLREYGWKNRYTSFIPGINSRLDELQAAVLRVKLRTLDAANEKRRQIAQIYLEGLSNLNLVLPKTRTNGEHVFHLFVIQTEKREPLKEALSARGIGTGIHYPIPIHLQPAYLEKLRLPVSMVQTEKAALKVLSLPMYPELPVEQAREVVQCLQSLKESL